MYKLSPLIFLYSPQDAVYWHQCKIPLLLWFAPWSAAVVEQDCTIFTTIYIGRSVPLPGINGVDPSGWRLFARSLALCILHYCTCAFIALLCGGNAFYGPMYVHRAHESCRMQLFELTSVQPALVKFNVMHKLIAANDILRHGNCAISGWLKRKCGALFAKALASFSPYHKRGIKLIRAEVLTFKTTQANR